MEKKITKNYKFSQQTQTYLTEMKDKWGLENEVEALRMVISKMHSKEFPDYIQVQRTRASVDPREKAIIKADASIEAQNRREQARKDKERNHAVEIGRAHV